jgi:CyaY protein
MISETAFVEAADATLERIGDALDGALKASDADVDWSCNDGILEIECERGGKVIVNRHVPNRELWLAARSGGFHFKAVDGAWRDTRSGEDLPVTLARVLREQCGLNVELAGLAAPGS